MGYSASHRFARIAPRKARLVADLIRGLDAEAAMAELELSKKRAAWYFKAVLKSAMSNAEESAAELPTLYVRESRVDEGPRIKRFQPKDRGRAHLILKKTSHLHLILDRRA
jgi:large subunit ribosomal protein L22